MQIMGDIQPESSQQSGEVSVNNARTSPTESEDGEPFSILPLPDQSLTHQSPSIPPAFNFMSLRNLQMSLANADNDLSNEELQEKLKEMVIKNHRLMDTLKLTNATIREQYETLLRWQANIVQNNQETNRKFLELKQMIKKQDHDMEELKKENAGKLEELTGFKTKVEELESTLANVNEEREKLGARCQAIDIAYVDLQTEKEQADMAMEKMKASLGAWSLEKQKLRKNNDDLESQISDLRLQIENQAYIPPTSVMSGFSMLTREDAEIQTSYDKQMEDHSSYIQLNKELQDKVNALTQELNFQIMKVEVLQNTVDEQQTNMAAVTEQLGQRQQEVAELEEKLRGQQVNFGTGFVQVPPSHIVHQLMTSQQQFQEATSDVSRYQQERYDSLSHCLIAYENRLGNLDAYAGGDSVAIDMLRSEIRTLKSLLTAEEERGTEERRKFNELSQQFNRLLNDYQDVMHLYEEQVHAGDQNKIHQDIKQRNFQEKLDEVTANLITKEDMLTQSNTEMVDLKKMVSEMQQLIENQKIQSEVFQKDFIMERESRENMATQRDRLEEEVKNLTSLNQYLQDELQTYQRGQFNQMHGGGAFTEIGGGRHHHRRHSRRISRDGPSEGHEGSPYNRTSSTEASAPPIWMGGRNPIPAATGDSNMFLCPKCQMAFSELQPLENHVHACLNNEDPFHL